MFNCNKRIRLDMLFFPLEIVRSASRFSSARMTAIQAAILMGIESHLFGAWAPPSEILISVKDAGNVNKNLGICNIRDLKNLLNFDF